MDPSTTSNGAFEEDTDPIPRTRILGEEPRLSAARRYQHACRGTLNSLGSTGNRALFKLPGTDLHRRTHKFFPVNRTESRHNNIFQLRKVFTHTDTDIGLTLHRYFNRYKTDIPENQGLTVCNLNRVGAIKTRNYPPWWCSSP